MNNPFDDQNPLTKMGNNQAINSPFGKNSQFYTGDCNTFVADFYTGAVKQPQLRYFLHYGHENKAFDWTRYITDAAYSEQIMALPERSSTRVALPITEQTAQPEFQFIKLNKNRCLINPTPSYRINIDIANKIFSLQCFYFYKNAIKNGYVIYKASFDDTSVTNAAPTVSDDNLDKYIAAELATYHIKLYLAFMKAAEHIHLENTLLEEIKHALPKLAQQPPATVEWFYSLMTATILQQLPKEILWRDLKKLLQYDHSNWWDNVPGFADNSNTTLNVMRGILQQPNGYEYLYTQFEAAPHFVKQLYYSLDGTTPTTGPSGETQILDNHSIFAAMLHALTMEVFQRRKQPFEARAAFVVDQNFKLDGDAVYDNAPKGQFRLTQMQKIQHQSVENGQMTKYHTWQMLSETTILLAPLDIVQLTIEQAGRPRQTFFCPAIYAKDIAYLAEWDKIDAITRAGFNVLAVAGGVAALGTGNPLILTLAVADIALAGVDLLTQATRDYLESKPWGKDFLHYWEQIYQIGGIVVAVGSAPYLLKSLYQTGATALQFATGKTREFVKVVLTSAILRHQSATKVFLKAEIGAAAISKNLPISGVYSAALQRLEEAGVLLAKLEDVNGKVSYTAIYRGEVIVPAGTPQEMRTILKKALRQKGDKLKKELIAVAIENNTKLKSWDSVSGRGRRLGQRIKKSELKNIAVALNHMKIELILVPKKGSFFLHGFNLKNGNILKMPEKAQAYFVVQGKKGALVLREGATIYEFLHEYMHLRHAKRLGYENYIALGSKYTKGELIKEQEVFDKIIQFKYLLTRDEVEHAIWYINKIRSMNGKNSVIIDFELKSIPEIRSEIRIQELLNKK